MFGFEYQRLQVMASNGQVIAENSYGPQGCGLGYRLFELRSWLSNNRYLYFSAYRVTERGICLYPYPRRFLLAPEVTYFVDVTDGNFESLTVNGLPPPRRYIFPRRGGREGTANIIGCCVHNCPLRPPP